jgi:hypothetical protein
MNFNPYFPLLFFDLSGIWRKKQHKTLFSICKVLYKSAKKKTKDYFPYARKWDYIYKKTIK